MKKLHYGVIILAFLACIPLSATAQVIVNVNMGLPPPLVFQEPPDVIVIPDTYYVYVVPIVDADLFFWNGWWWRSWQGRWYRSRHYDRGWAYYKGVPAFYYDVDPNWRGYYRDRNWYGHPWYYEHISQQRLNRNWQRWNENRHWQKGQTWGVQDYKTRPEKQRQEVRRQRQQEYERRPEVREQRQQKLPEAQRREPKQQPKVQQPGPPQGKDQRPGPPGKPEGWGSGPRK